MINKTYHILFNAKLFFILIPFFFSSGVFSQQLLVNPQLNINSISQDELRAVYSMRTRVWPNGQRITVFILNPDNSTHRSFCLKYLELFPYQLQRVWDVMIFSGTGQSPIKVNSDAEMLRKIANTPGSIGYISDKGVADNVKIISIQK